jgi:hypothetical protein
MSAYPRDDQFDLFSNFDLFKREAISTHLEELPQDFADLKPDEIIDIKYVETAQAFPFTERKILANITLPPVNIIKIRVHFISLKKLTVKKKIWITDISLLGAYKKELLVKFRNHIENAALNENMKDFSECRLKILDELFVRASIEIPGLKRTEVKKTVISDKKVTLPSPEKEIFPAVIPYSDSARKKTEAREQRKPSNRTSTLPREALKAPFTQRNGLMSPRARVNKIKNEDNIFYDNFSAENKSNLKQRLTENNKSKLSSSDYLQQKSKTSHEREESTQVSTHTKQVEERLDYWFNIELNERVLEIKRKFYNLDLIKAEVVRLEFQNLIESITASLDEFSHQASDSM